MRPNAKTFVELVAEAHHRGPVVEFGSRRVENQEQSADLRPFFNGLKYIGCDRDKGTGVDRVVDCCHTGLRPASAATVLVCEMLEHAADPFAIICEAGRIVSKRGVVVVTVPFNFPIHQLPDYWRFTPEGLERLFDLGGLPHRAIFFQGDLAQPHSILAVASKSRTTASTIYQHLSSRLHRVPGTQVGETLYGWAGREEYIRARFLDSQNRN